MLITCSYSVNYFKKIYKKAIKLNINCFSLIKFMNTFGRTI